MLVGLLHLPSLAVTLGTLAAYRGLAFVDPGQVAASIELPDGLHEDRERLHLERAARSRCGILIGSRSCFGVLLHGTRFGRYVYAIGSNREAARFSGVPVDRVRVDGIRHLGAHGRGLAACSISGYFGACRPSRGGPELLDVVAAVVLGGVDIFGGSGTILGVLLALVLIADLRNGMQLANLAARPRTWSSAGCCSARSSSETSCAPLTADPRRGRRVALERRWYEVDAFPQPRSRNINQGG